MSMKIRCSECRKKIAVDEAFAGSMCRCPYCKSIIKVPSDASYFGGSPARPSRPGGRFVRPAGPKRRIKPAGERSSGLEYVTGSRPIISEHPPAAPSRPTKATRIETPGVPQMPEKKTVAPSAGESKPPTPPAQTAQADVSQLAEAEVIVETVHVDESKLSAEELAAIPMADPVRLQGIVSLILLGVLLVSVVACIYLGVRLFGRMQQEDSAYYDNGVAIEDDDVVELENPFVVSPDTPAVCKTISIQAPVAYCIDGGGRMGDVLLFARDVARASILSLEGGKFGVFVATETEAGQTVKFVGGKMFTGGQAGEQALRKPLEQAVPGSVGAGATDLAQLIDSALKKKPRTVVLIIRNKGLKDPHVLGEKIQRAGARLVLVVLEHYDHDKQSYVQTVKAAGGTSILLAYDSLRTLQQHYDDRELPEDE